MKKKITFFLVLSMFGLGLLTPVVGLAATEDKPETTTDKIEKTLDARYQQYKKDHPTNLTEKQLNRLKNLCTPAQAKTKQLTQVAVDKGDKRSKLYQQIVERVESLVAELKDYDGQAEISIVELEVKTTELKAKVDSFKLDISTYQVALNDLSSINCEEFTDTFKSALEEVREQKAGLVSSSDEIKQLINQSIKPELAKIKEALSEQTDSAGDKDNG